MKKVLIVSSSFPPTASVGASVRLAKLCKYLPQHGWQPIVLTRAPSSSAPARPSETLFAELADRVEIRTAAAPEFHAMYSGVKRIAGAALRAVARLRPARDAASSPDSANGSRTLEGGYLRLVHWLFVPDDQVLWMRAATRAALRLYDEQGFDAIYSSSPLPSNHLVAARIARRTHVPWIAEFRDPWLDSTFRQPRPLALAEKLERRMEERILRGASHVVAVSTRYVATLRARMPGLALTHIPNGYDPADFATIVPRSRSRSEFVLVHAGNLYTQRSPVAVLQALALLRGRNAAAANVRLELIGVVPRSVEAQIAELGLADAVRIVPSVPHPEALQRMVDAAALLLLPGPGEGYVPGKVYEYLAARRPILAVTESAEIVTVLTEAGGAHEVVTDEPRGIADAIERLHRRVTSEGGDESDATHLRQYDRIEIARRTAELLDRLAGS